MIKDFKKIEEDFLNEHYQDIIDKINSYYELKKGFTAQDLLEENKKEAYYVHMTKGILFVLLDFNLISIIATYNGNKNYIYLANQKIKTKNEHKQ